LAFLFLLYPENIPLFEFSLPVDFATPSRSRNSRNKGHAKKNGFYSIWEEYTLCCYTLVLQ